jgi:hypothetical protein
MRIKPKHARVNPRWPEAWAVSDRSGFIGNHRDLKNAVEWAGFELVTLNNLVFPWEYDEPQRQLGALILSVDPPPIEFARPEQYYIEEQTFRLEENGVQRVLMDGTLRLQSNRQGTSQSLMPIEVTP